MKIFVTLAVVALVGAALIEGRAIRDLKSTLTTKGNDLVKKAEEAIKKLEAEHKTHEVTVIKTEEAQIKKLISELEAATDDAKVKHIEHQLSQAEHKLQFELQKIEHHGAHPHTHQPHLNPTTQKTPTKRDLKSSLITRGNDLVKKADEAIKKLETEHKTHEVTVIKAEEAAIQKLIKSLEAETDNAKIVHLEHQLNQAEHKLQFELLKVNHHGVGPHVPHIPHIPHIPTDPKIPAKRDVKSDLIAKAKTLLTKADEAITKAQTAHKTHDVATLKTEENHIKKLVADLEAATDDAKVKQLEHNLSRAEVRLQHHLDHLAH